MISKELLSEVLGIKCNCYKEMGDDSIIYPLVHYGFVKGIEQVGNAKQYPKGINIYELAHKCKEWAFNKNEDISVYRMRGFLKPTYSVCVMIKDLNGRDEKWKRIEDAYTEPEAIFKACDYILNKLSNK